MSLIAIAVMGQYLGHVYVSPHPPETVPCPLAAVQQELVHGRHFNRISVGDVFIETDQGSVNCSQQYVGSMYCTFPRARILTVQQGEHPVVRYEIPRGARVTFESRDGRHACRLGRWIRTHGDTIVPDLPTPD